MKKVVLITFIMGGICVGLFGYFKKQNSNQNLTWEEQISSDKLTDEQFAKLYRQALQETLPDAEIDISEILELKVNLGERQFICWLGNAWNECRNQPNIRIDTCNYYIDSFLRTLKDNQDIKKDIDPNLIIPEITTVRL